MIAKTERETQIDAVTSSKPKRDYRKSPRSIRMIDRIALAYNDLESSGIEPKDRDRLGRKACKAAIAYGLSRDATRLLFDAWIQENESPQEWTDDEIDSQLADVASAGDIVTGEGLVAFIRHEAWDDPFRLARRALRAYGYEPLKPQELRLRFYQGQFFEYIENGYRVVSDADVESHVQSVCQRYASIENQRLDYAFQKVVKSGKKARRAPAAKASPATLRAVVSSIRSMVNVSDSHAMPCWLGDDPTRPPADQLASCLNGIVRIVGGADQPIELMDPTPELFTVNGLPFEFDPLAQCPTWLAFLKSVWGDDQESIDTLQTWFGYLLTPSTKYHKMLTVIGPPRSGKGTIARVLKGLLGDANVSAPKLTQLANNFGLQSLVGKRAALIGDARVSNRADQVAITEALLGIIGEDPQTIDRKYLPSLDGVILPTRFTLFSNESPALFDASGAIIERLIVLRMERGFVGREDLDLSAKLTHELPGIFNWSVDGLCRLEREGRFQQPASGFETLKQITDISNPVKRFVNDRYIVAKNEAESKDESFEVLKQSVYETYREWCMEKGYSTPKTESIFARDLYASNTLIGDGRRRKGAVRDSYYTGIRPRNMGGTCD